jgi:hypothetical protein
MGKLSKRVRTCNRKSLKHLFKEDIIYAKVHLQGKKESISQCTY